MYLESSRFLVCLLLFASPLALGQNAPAQNSSRNGGDFSDNVLPQNKVPAGVILVKGAWSSASDSVTPLPEGGTVANHIFTDRYFAMTYPLPADWDETFKGPPPSDSGRYVLAQLGPAETFKGPNRGTILITAQDIFFTPLPANNALELVNFSKNNLPAEYKVEMPPTQTRIADRPFTFFAYWSPVAQLHWYIFAAEIRCHAVEIVMTSRDTKLLETLTLDLNKMKLPAEIGPTTGTGGGDAPVCLKDYAQDQNVMSRVDPVFTMRHFNAVPVRIIIDKKGKVKHLHFLSAFPDQAKVITDALLQWKFKPYQVGGQATEVETGIMFGTASSPRKRPASTGATE